jgi:hypothetical protein
MPAVIPILGPDDLGLLHRLEAGTWHDRKSAEAELAARGADQEPLVRAMLAQTASPEAQARLTAILDQLNLQVQIGPSLITMRLKNAPAKEVFAELFRQAHAPLGPSTPPNLLDTLGPLSVDADHQPFWTVMQQLEKTTSVRPLRAPDGRCGLAHMAPIPSGPQVLSDQFLVVLWGVQRAKLPTNAPGANRTIQFNLSFCIEPKTRVMPMSPQITIEQATDDHGNVLPESRLAAALPRVGIPLDWAPFRYYLQLPEKNPGARLTSLRVKLSAQVALDVEHIEIPDVMHAGPQAIDVNGTTVRFNGCSKVQQIYQIALTSAPDPTGNVQRVVKNSEAAPRLEDAQGQPIMRVGTSTAYRLQGNEITYMYSMTNGMPKRMTWDIPTELRTIDVPIDFEHLNIDLTH